MNLDKTPPLTADDIWATAVSIFMPCKLPVLSSETISFFMLNPFRVTLSSMGLAAKMSDGGPFNSIITQEVCILGWNTATSTDVFTFLAYGNGYCYYNSGDLKNIQKTNLRVIDSVAPRHGVRNWKQSAVIYIISTPRKDICSIILKGFLATSEVWRGLSAFPWDSEVT